MSIQGMNHFTVLTHDLQATRDFYIGILGLRDGYRPDLGFPGSWLYVGDQAVLHIIAGRTLPEEPGGVLDHMAFTASDLKAVTGKLKSRGIDYILRRQNESRTWQLFCHDPSGAKVELDFAASEEGPPA
jgi:catechol 2,3-dioxygenase-like lactoylglutathione lyase family enzyme